ncbi:hypothetical protein V7x_08520 [Crateriforma conspicua]|uniref:Uncharacterized protein n=1 Tax=Crateriforma conspicua TaxID=2527996 RepID=A0A5C6FSN8_9PLAN|nr:hypothetical protein V7x_08520 [Crateriforma conspicua]
MNQATVQISGSGRWLFLWGSGAPSHIVSPDGRLGGSLDAPIKSVATARQDQPVMRPTANFLSSSAFVVSVFPFGAISAKSAICGSK